MNPSARTCAILALALGSVAGCKAHVLHHDQHVAAKEAETFLRHAVVEQDFAAAHGMLREDARQRVSEAALADAVKQQHVNGYPTSVRAIEYEPVPGQAAIQIFLLGENSSEKFYYRVPLVGTVDSGYSPDGVYRGTGPYPSSSLRQRLDK